MQESEVFRALSDPTRRALLERLVAKEMSVSQLTADFHISQPAVSQHLSALKVAGLIAERKEGRFTYYSAVPGGIQPLLEWISRHRALWPKRVDKLKQVLKRMDQ